jgi:acetyltransferase-like isoleucine patch superfamily enzyme
MGSQRPKLTPGDFWDISINTRWKLFDEILMYLINPFVRVYFFLNGVQLGKGSKFYGFPKILKHRKSRIVIGDNFEARSWWFSNPLGVNHALILSTWEDGAEIIIGDDVGITGGSVVSAKSIKIGDRTLIGANSTIMDTNFHPLKGDLRYSKLNVATEPIVIGKNVFIGMNAIILKGMQIQDNSVIAAGEIVRNE